MSPGPQIERVRRHWPVLLPLLLLVVLALACNLAGGGDEEQQRTPERTQVAGGAVPSVVIEAPQNNAQVLRDSDVLVYAVASDPQGVTRVELKVNGVVVDARPSPTTGGDKQLKVLLKWRPVTTGEQTLEVVPYRDNVQGKSATIKLIVRERASQITQTPAPTLSFITPTQVQNRTCRVQVAVGALNVRRGPGLNYDVLGQITIGQEYQIIGRQIYPDQWWQIYFTGTFGWVSGYYVNVLGECGTIPIVIPPPTPTPRPNVQPPTIPPTFTPLPTIAPSATPTGTSIAFNPCRVRIVTDGLPVYNDSFVRITIVTSGQEFYVLARDVSARWYRIAIAGTTGWVSAGSVNLLGSCGTLAAMPGPVTPVPTTQPPPPPTGRPSVSPIAEQVMTVGETRYVLYTAFDPQGDTFRGVATSSNDQVVSAAILSPGTITLIANSVGTATVTVNLDDQRGDRVSTSFRVTVNQPEQPPTIAPIGNQTMTVGDTLDVRFTASDPNGGPLTVVAQSDNGSIVSALVISDNTVRLTANGVGTAIVTLSVEDSTGRSASTSFTVTARGRPNAPRIEPIPNQTLNTDEVRDVPFTASDPDGDTLRASVRSASENVVTAAIPSDGVIRLTAQGVGSAVVTVTVDDGQGGTANASFTVTVSEPVNNAPTIAPIANQRLTAGETLDVTFTATDPEGDPITATAASNNNEVVLAEVTDNDTVRLTAAGAGSAEVTITATDTHGNSRQVAFTVTVQPRPNAPTIEPISNQSLTVGESRDIPFVASDADGDPLTATARSGDTNIVAVEIRDNNQVRLTANAAGTTTVTVTVSDGRGGTASASFQVTVVEPDADSDGLPDDEDPCPNDPAHDNVGDPCNHDEDNDTVPDAEDDCPNEAGPADNNGCPYGDADGDGVPDPQDNCPDEPGPAENNGCPLDTDADGIPDDQDQCPNNPGTAETNGCPDTDGDGLIDRDDNCPNLPGPAENGGCPDTDADGIIDPNDACPDQPGPRENNGCPADADQDGIPDDQDQCPNEAGPAENNGCPLDTDADGIPDDQDQCPDEAGSAATNGCPDTDSDGVADDQDQCPTEAGPAENNGCPADADQDGIPDDQDQCPNNPGTAETNGCPDTDGDGLIDREDACPELPGPADNGGCPLDADSDGIPDDQDQCPTQAGPVENNGCPPDTDGDGIPDDQDNCRNLPGPAENNGCPDTDADGIIDPNDACPDQPGPRENNGCPVDTDGDTIPDDQDACPNRPGPAETNGCPDTDGDGVIDRDDACPEQAGPVENGGCPQDSDGDGVTDNQDACPDQPGPAENNGCPADSDGDGLIDDQDSCPNQPGPAGTSGCPDADGDGVADQQDSCPDQAGPADNGGCPPQAADTDADGLPDDQDACPNEPGPAENGGCPVQDQGGAGEVIVLNDLPNITPIEGDVLQTVQGIYQSGLSMSPPVNPGVFSIVGDTPPGAFMDDLSGGTGNFGDLDDAAELSDVVFYYAVEQLPIGGNSFLSGGMLASGVDWTVSDLLDPNNADPRTCQPGETPLDCELRVNRPAVVFVSIGRNDFLASTPINTFEQDLTTVVNTITDWGAIPVLIMVPGHPNDYPALRDYNTVIARMADDNNLVLLNIARRINDLPTGLNPDLTLTAPADLSQYSSADLETYGASLRNVLALRTLQRLRLAVPIP